MQTIQEELDLIKAKQQLAIAVSIILGIVVIYAAGASRGYKTRGQVIKGQQAVNRGISRGVSNVKQGVSSMKQGVKNAGSSIVKPFKPA